MAAHVSALAGRSQGLQRLRIGAAELVGSVPGHRGHVRVGAYVGGSRHGELQAARWPGSHPRYLERDVWKVSGRATGGATGICGALTVAVRTWVAVTSIWSA